MAYTFTTLNPPLLVDNPDPRAIPAAALSQIVGTATWVSQREIRTGDRVLSFEVYDGEFELVRFLRWSLREGPLHRAEDFTVTVTETRGYSVNQKRTFEQTLEVTTGADAELTYLKLSASVKDTLKITAETTRDWRLETVTQTQRVFKGGSSYYLWDLTDGFSLKKSVKTTYLLGTGRRNMGTSGPVTTNADFVSVIGIYEDKR